MPFFRRLSDPALRARRRRKELGLSLVVTHFIGSTPESADHVSLSQRLMMEIKEKFAVAAEIPSDPDKVGLVGAAQKGVELSDLVRAGMLRA